jgi:erythromycin esterase-like protein
MPDPRLIRFVRPLDGSARQFDPIVERIGDSRTVLIGAATHGTHEFHQARAALTRQLIADLGFAGVVVEADWPDAYRVNRYVRGESEDRSAYEALDDFQRFPSWMWRNHVIAEFVEWLRQRNDNHREEDRAGFYGMDAPVLESLDDADPGRVNAWNLRGHQMLETCEALREHLDTHGAGDKLVIWAHNSHVGDARATEWRNSKRVNLGQLMRERHGEDDVVLIGCSTHSGTVTTASHWDGPAELGQVRPSLRGSWERMLHELGRPRFFVSSREAREVLDEERLTRALGVIYRPETEPASHYYGSRIGRQFDVIVHYDETRALQPLARRHVQEALRDPAEIHPFGV